MMVEHLYNKNPSSIGGISRLESLFGKSSKYKILKAFDSKCFPSLRPCKSLKLDRKSMACAFLGYQAQHEGYLCLEPISRKMYTFEVCGVIFYVEGAFA